MRILVVDDELVSRQKMLFFLMKLGDCVGVESGETAMSALADAFSAGTPFDLVTLDISMPGMDGLQVLEGIRKMEQAKGTPPAVSTRVIMVTGDRDRQTVEHCLKLGCCDYIVKPFDQETIRRKICTIAGQP